MFQSWDTDQTPLNMTYATSLQKHSSVTIFKIGSYEGQMNLHTIICSLSFKHKIFKIFELRGSDEGTN